MSRYIFTLIINIGLMGQWQSFGQTDTAAIADTVKPKVRLPERSGRHLTLGIDVAHPVMNRIVSGRESYELTADYYLSHDLYVVADGGFGSSFVNYSDLKYTTNNSFLKAGVNRSLLLRNDSADWNNMLIGFRLGAADINRNAASYVVTDSLWGNSSGIQPGKSFVACWVEIGMGVRVEIIKNFSAGWFMSGRFMLNEKSFKDLAPAYISGFGRGDKNSAFDFDFFVTYSFNWKRKSQRQQAIVVTPAIGDSTKK